MGTPLLRRSMSSDERLVDSDTAPYSPARSLGIFPSVGSSFMKADYHVQAGSLSKREQCLPSLDESSGQVQESSKGASSQRRGTLGSSKPFIATRHSLPAGTLKDNDSSSAAPQSPSVSNPRGAPSSKQLLAQRHSLPAGTPKFDRVSGSDSKGRSLMPARSSHALRGNVSAPHFALSVDTQSPQTSYEAPSPGGSHAQSLAVPSPMSWSRRTWCSSDVGTARLADHIARQQEAGPRPWPRGGGEQQLWDLQSPGRPSGFRLQEKESHQSKRLTAGQPSQAPALQGPSVPHRGMAKCPSQSTIGMRAPSPVSLRGMMETLFM